MKRLNLFELSIVFILVFLSIQAKCTAQSKSTDNRGSNSSQQWKKVDEFCITIEDKVISWRRDLHQNPELGNREFRTSGIIAEHLKELGLEVQTGIAHTGVVGILKGKYDGPVVALRADMDALPVKELVDLPFASKILTEYNGQTVPVMHACGHDAHVAMLLGTAEVLIHFRNELHGTVIFIFQPAEDSKPEGENGGAELMIQEGVLENPKVDAIFGLHVVPYPSSNISYRAGGLFAAVDNFTIRVKGWQAHGALPWTGVDAITVSAQIITSLQTIISRQIDLTSTPAVITIGAISGGTQQNILSGEVTMKGTIRSFSATSQKDIQGKIKQMASLIAEASGAIADVSFINGVPVVFNDNNLTGKMSITLNEVISKSGISITPPITVGDDFSFYTQKIPGFYFLLGVAPEGADPNKIINHSPFFIIDESALKTGVMALSHLAIDYLNKYGPKVN